MRHFASSRFWASCRALPDDIRKLDDRNFALLKADPRHASLQLKKIGQLWSVRIGAHYRALGVDVGGGIYWIWIGSHADYDRVVR